MSVFKKVIPPSSNPQRIGSLHFSFLTPEDIRQLSSVDVHNQELYLPNPEFKPSPNGVLDLRLGTTTGEICQTCKKSKEDCPGHFGKIELAFPVYNIGFHSSIIHILKCICKTCSNILLPLSDIEHRLKILYRSNFHTVSSKKERIKNLIKECEKVVVCPHCGAINGPVKKTKSILFILHTVGQKTKEYRETFLSKFGQVSIKGSDISNSLQNCSDDITPLRCLQLFQNIPVQQFPLLISGLSIASPADMIITSMIVPPTCIRPPVESPGEGTRQDDLTFRLREAVEKNKNLNDSTETGNKPGNFMDNWNQLQQTITGFINSDSSDIVFKANKKNKPMIGILQRLKGKQGRFRNNLSEKRVNFTGRTVISPDPNANVDQVIVPREMAMILTFPTRVNQFNIEMLRNLIRTGPNEHPGANIILKSGKTYKTNLLYADREKEAQELRDGDIVERHLIANDTVLFNRQPSLHRISIMAFRAKIMPSRTLRFNECACAPFNADFDGDEMNIHLPQTLEAASDARVLMNILNNLFSPRAGELIIAPTQDFLSGTYILTRKNVFFDYNHLSFLLNQIFDGQIKIDIVQPAIVYPVQLWTGKQVISMLLKPNSSVDFGFTHSIPNKEFKKISDDQSEGDSHMDINDGYVSFLDGQLISGVLEKSLIGGGQKSIWAILARDISPKICCSMHGKNCKSFCEIFDESRIFNWHY